MNNTIPPKIVAWMRNTVAGFVSLALILLCTPFQPGVYDIFFFSIGMALICCLVAMIATQKEFLVGILFAVGYSSVNMLRMKLEHSYLAQEEGWLDFLGDCLVYSIFSLIGTTPVYLWRRWRR